MRDEEYHYERMFLDLFEDAARLALDALRIGNLDDSLKKPWTYCRASVLMSVLSLECAANCCIEALGLPGSFKRDVDQLPFLSKFELFLKLRSPTTCFDRGRFEVQAVAELKTIRDALVHPKIRRAPWVEIEPNLAEADHGEYKLLRIPRSASQWFSREATVALRAVSDFLDLVFLDLCALDRNVACDILMSRGKPEFQRRTAYNVRPLTFKRAHEEFGIQFRILGLDQS